MLAASSSNEQQVPELNSESDARASTEGGAHCAVAAQPAQAAARLAAGWRLLHPAKGAGVNASGGASCRDCRAGWAGVHHCAPRGPLAARAHAHTRSALHCTALHCTADSLRIHMGCFIAVRGWAWATQGHPRQTHDKLFFLNTLGLVLCWVCHRAARSVHSCCCWCYW